MVDTGDPSTLSKEAEASLVFVVPDTGPYNQQEVKLIREASSNWQVSRSYNCHSLSEAQKTITFKVYFRYRIANDPMEEKFPGLEQFTETLKRFILKLDVGSRKGSEDNLTQGSNERCRPSGEDMAYDMRYIPGHKPKPKPEDVSNRSGQPASLFFKIFPVIFELIILRSFREKLKLIRSCWITKDRIAV